jgi:hypothetical protein
MAPVLTASGPQVVGRQAVRRLKTAPKIEHAHRPSRAEVVVGWRPIIVAATGAGLLLLGLADDQARTDGAAALPPFWAGILLMVGPSTWRLVSPSPKRNERISIVLILGLALYLVKVMVNPLAFSLPDEFTHWRTLNDILTSGHLFTNNPLLGISPEFPGLEAATVAAKVSSGLDTFPLAMILMGAARAVTMLSLFLMAASISGSARVAGIASMVYTGNVSFLPFDAMFSYETLALPLAFLAVWAVHCWYRHSGRSVLHGCIALGAIAATTVTHHLTSLALVALLVAWAFVSLIGDRGSKPRWPILVAAAWAATCTAVWFATAGGLAVSYLEFVVLGGVDELLAVLRGTTAAKQLFVPRGGIVAPIPEIVAAYASVALMLLALPFMLLHAVRGRRPTAIVLVLGLAALLYPVSLALRFTVAGSETSQRASEFLFVPLGILGADWLAGSRLSLWRPRRREILVPILLVVFVGGLVSGDPPQGRLPGPYHVAAEQRSIEAEGVETAAWALRELGPNNRLIADRTNAKLLGSIGGQYPVTSANQHVGTAYVMFAPTIGRSELDIIRRGNIHYVVVDLRLARDVPVYPYYFESAEPDAGQHTTPFPLASLQKFDGLPGVTRIYDSGDIIIYDVRGLVDVTP